MMSHKTVMYLHGAHMRSMKGRHGAATTRRPWNYAFLAVALACVRSAACSCVCQGGQNFIGQAAVSNVQVSVFGPLSLRVQWTKPTCNDTDYLGFEIQLDMTYTVESSGSQFTIPVTHKIRGLPVTQTTLVLNASSPIPDYTILDPDNLFKWTGFQAGARPSAVQVKVTMLDDSPCFGMSPNFVPTVTGPPGQPTDIKFCPLCGGSGRFKCNNPCVKMAPYGGFLTFVRPSDELQGQGAAGVGSLLLLHYHIVLYNDVTGDMITSVTIQSDDTVVGYSFNHLPIQSHVRALINTVNGAGPGDAANSTSHFFPAGFSKPPTVLRLKSGLGSVDVGHYIQIELGVPSDTGDVTNTRLPVLAYQLEMSQSNFTTPGDSISNAVQIEVLEDFDPEYHLRFVLLAVGEVWYVKARVQTIQGFSAWSSPPLPRQLRIPPSVPRLLQTATLDALTLSVSFVNPNNMGAGPGWQTEEERVTDLEYHVAIATQNTALDEESDYQIAKLAAPRLLCNASSTPCVFPFIYEGISYDTCIDVGKGQQLWCSQTSNYDIDALYSSCTCTNITSDARTSAQLHFDISNLSAGTQYWVAVRARSDSSNPAIYSPTVPSGVGPWTALNAITVIGQPDTPPFITTSANGSQGIRMNWVRPADTGLGGVAQPLLMYQIELSEISCCKMVRMLSAADYYTTLFLENLEVGTQVYARIRTVNVVGKSLFSAYSDAATVVLLPSPPLDVTVALAPLTTYQQNLFYTDGRMPRSAQIEISFGRPYDTGLRSINDTTWRLLKYKITASLNSSGIAGQGGNCSGAHGNSIIQLEMLDISAPIQMEGLNIGCSWIFRVTAFNEAGEGGVGGGISKMMVIPAFAPKNLHVRAVADETIRVEWERPSNTGTGDSLNPILWWHLDLTMNVSGLAVLYQACNDSSYVASTESDEWNFNVTPLNWMEHVLQSLMQSAIVSNVSAQQGCGRVSFRIPAQSVTSITLNNVFRGIEVTAIIFAQNEAGAGQTATNVGQSLVLPSEATNPFITKRTCGAHSEAALGGGSESATVGLYFNSPTEFGASLPQLLPNGFQYEIEASPANGSGSSCNISQIQLFIPDSTRSDLKFDVGGLTQHCVYLFRVRATNEVGAGNWSAVIEYQVLLFDCVCSVGYTAPSGLDNQLCAACVPGKYKSELGAANCSACPTPPQIYAHGDRAGYRIQDPSKFPGWRAMTSTSAAASSNVSACIVACPAGFSGASVSPGQVSVCRQCAAGSFKYEAGPHDCTCRSCAVNTCATPP